MAHPEANLIGHHTKLAKYGPAAVGLLLPLLLQAFGTHFVRTADTCLLDVLLALGMNVVVGYAGLLDLGYVAFYAVGAYLFALLASPHLGDNFAWIAALCSASLHSPWWGHPVNVTEGAKGMGLIDSVRIFEVDPGRTWHVGGYPLTSVTLYC